ncbi:FAD-dependent oxidoreductase [Nonomuraea sediminis]|uniref:FAD-dependent oxidoreductase n=1 Tax=Nonomuraea sediminis TaxID=2835864 RepID=UPI001BDD9CCE|nr:NAD(P)/FAD-dependent oxidoreductase [Nonomuraea sediminis]
MSDHDPILIAGGGIGGLTAALALRLHGFPVEVYERRPDRDIESGGTGQTIYSNATTALSRLGLAEGLKTCGVVVTRAESRTERDTLLFQTDLREYEWPGSHPSMAVRRGGLCRVLMDACERAGVTVHLDSPCAGYTDHGDNVTLHLKDGRQVTGALLVGADGIGSAIRAQLIDDGGPVPLGITSYRGISPDSGGLPDGTIYLFRGLDAKVAGGAWPIGPEETSWSVSTYAPPGQHEKDRARMKARALDLLTGVNGPPRPVVEGTPLDAVIRTDIMVRRWSDTWVRGRVALLGDSAHAMPTELGQGACQAIEDAVVLAEQVADHADPAAALLAYQRLRMPRVRWVHDRVYRMRRVKPAKNAVVRRIVDALAKRIVAKAQPKMWRELLKPPPMRDLSQPRTGDVRTG